jgi:hypothetical protein
MAKGTKVVAAKVDPESNGEAPAPKKRVCPINRKHFDVDAKPVTVVVDGKEFRSQPKQFSTGSMGWNISEKVTIKVGDELVDCQLGMNLTVIGSKDLPPM